MNSLAFTGVHTRLLSCSLEKYFNCVFCTQAHDAAENLDIEGLAPGSMKIFKIFSPKIGGKIGVFDSKQS
jgi:hypothetical protein